MTDEAATLPQPVSLPLASRLRIAVRDHMLL